jgi:hypothetical protein
MAATPSSPSSKPSPAWARRIARRSQGCASPRVIWAPRRTVIREGERPDHVHLVVEGWAARYKLLPDGARQITAFLLPGDFCDLHVTILGEMDHSITTLTRAKVAYIPALEDGRGDRAAEARQGLLVGDPGRRGGAARLDRQRRPARRL